MKQTITVFSLRSPHYGRANAIAAGPIASRVLPRLRASVEQVFDLGV